MAESDGYLGAAPRSESVHAGRISTILRELARCPDEDARPAPERALQPGVVVGRFEVVREIGRGGFGVVYEARDRQLGRAVAFKVVTAGLRRDVHEERLLAEAEAAAQLSHPNIVTLYDVGRSEHGPYLVLELLHGQTLARRLSHGAVPPREALRIVREVARGVAHAHAHGVVHRDLTPNNIYLCDDGRVKLLDFGMAHAFGRRKIEGGTPAYMAPEQCRGAPEDERTDVFAMGVILYRMLANDLPFDDEGRSVRDPRIPALGALVGQMIAKDPVDRPRDGGAVLAALSACQRDGDRAPSSRERPAAARRRPARRFAAVAVALIFAGAAVVGGGALLVRSMGRAGVGGPTTVAVADFANQTGEPELDGLSGMLITSLEQSQRLAVLTRVRMLDVLHQLGKPHVTVVDEALGRELAIGAGARALVLASIRRFDDLYAIELKVLDPARSEYLFTLQESGRGKVSVPALIDRLSERTRERFRESPAEVQARSVKVASLTTGSLEAYQHYFRGEQLKEAIRYDAAIEEYRNAIAIDPGFALAHYRIAYLGKFTGLDDGSRRKEMDAALAHADRVPEKERTLIGAWSAIMDGRAAEAHATYARAVETYPQDKEVLFMAGDQFAHEDKWAEALPFMQRAVALDPTFEPALMHEADCLASLGRDVELTDMTRAWTERVPTSGAAFRALTMAHGMAGRVDETVAAARRAFELDGTGLSRVALAEAFTFAGRYAEVETLMRPAFAASAQSMDRLRGAVVLATALAYEGRRREALRIADLAAEDFDDKRGYRRILRLELIMGDGATDAVLREARGTAAYVDPPAGKRMAVALAMLGELEAAGRFAAELTGNERHQYDAVVAWKGGARDEALSALRNLAKAPEIDLRAPTLFLLAKIAAELGRDEDVIAAVEKLRVTYSGAWRSWGWPQALLLAAKAHDRLGERVQARALVEEVVAMWKDADPDLPMLAEAREMRSRLARR